MFKTICTVFLSFCLSSCTHSEGENSFDKKINVTASVEVSDSSEITCPHCGFKSMEQLPTDVCLLSYVCSNCGETLHPKDGDCCVFCTYGTHDCPSIQELELEN